MRISSSNGNSALGIDKWIGLSWGIITPTCPSMSIEISDNLDKLGPWLLCRVWPRRYPDLEDAFENFRRVLEAFQNTFHEHSDIRKDEYWTSKLYRIPEWDPEWYELLFDKHQYHIHLVADLLLELTRAANLIWILSGATFCMVIVENKDVCWPVTGDKSGLQNTVPMNGSCAFPSADQTIFSLIVRRMISVSDQKRDKATGSKHFARRRLKSPARRAASGCLARRGARGAARAA